MSEFKAKIASHSAAMAKIFNAEIVHFPCDIAEHGLFSGSLTVPCKQKDKHREFCEGHGDNN